MASSWLIQDLDVPQHVNGDGFVVFPHHSDRAENIDEPPQPEAADGAPEENVHPYLPKIEIMETGYGHQENESDHWRFRLFLKLGKEGTLVNFVHRGDLAQHGFGKLIF